MTPCCPKFTTITSSISGIFTSLFLLSIVGQVNSRARMVEPPMRSSYWRQDISREGISAPVNINDELLNCGGFEYQWKQRNGACGACGDKSGGIRENEYPGKYSQFPPQRTYRTRRTADVFDNDMFNVINVTIYVTANQLGYFYFRLCPYRDGPSLPFMDLEECFNSGSNLVVRDINTTRYYPGSSAGFHDLHLEIPLNVSCQHCILQWTYVTGYRERKSGPCEPCLGCGPQEHYVNCADIQILPEGATSVIDETGSPLLTTGRPQTPTFPPRPTPIPTVATVRNSTTRGPVIQVRPTRGPTNIDVTQSPVNTTQCTPSADIVMCEARDIQRLIPGMNQWCLENCKSGHCMPDFCDCYCIYPGYKIFIHPSAFDLKTSSRTSSSSSSSSSSTSSSAKYHCYKPTSLWSRTPGLSGWCLNNCPSKWCADMCSLQVCP